MNFNGRDQSVGGKVASKGGASSDEAFCWPIRVYYEDTDAGGVVYYANYLRFMERARTEWLRTMGVEIDVLAACENAMFVVRSANVDYLSPAKLNDALTVSVALNKLAGASFIVDQKINVARQRSPICKAVIRLVCVDSATHRPRRLPAALLQETKAWTK